MAIFAKNLLLGRVVALDYGKKRTGIAVTDPLRLIASGLTTIATHELLAFLKQYVKLLKKKFPQISIERQDERFTSKIAVQSMIYGGLKKKQRQNKALVDEISATLILQAFLNRQ